MAKGTGRPISWKELMKESLDEQMALWEQAFSEDRNVFGDNPSEPAIRSAELFQGEGIERILELGAGQGRDTIHFARLGFSVTAVDYSRSGLAEIRQRAETTGLTHLIRTVHHDVRNAFPFDDAAFDACYSHLLFCMALTRADVELLFREVRRVLKPRGLNIFTVRHSGDALFSEATPVSEDLYIFDKFILHFFDREKVIRFAQGYDVLEIDELEEGVHLRKLFRVTLRKK